MSHLLLLMHLILVTMPVAANPKEDIKTNNGSETELTTGACPGICSDARQAFTSSKENPSTFVWQGKRLRLPGGVMASLKSFCE